MMPLSHRLKFFAVVLIVAGTGTAGLAEDAASVNGKVISDQEVESAFRRTSVAKRKLTPDQDKTYRRHVLNLLIDEACLRQFLDQQQVTVPEEVVDKHVAQFKQALVSQGRSFDQFLADLGITEETMRNDIRNLHRWFAYADQKATPDTVAKYYEENKAAFDGTEVRASHILVKADPSASAADRAAARKKIEAIRAQLVGGTSFEAAAKAHSECPSKDMGGDLDFFPRKGVMAEPFAAAAFSLTPGQVSEIVETEFGYHLIKVTDRKPGKPVLFAEIYEDVKSAYADDLRTTVIQQVKANSDIKYLR
jgi:parvulin-like peptidyl-prolyl isomerase